MCFTKRDIFTIAQYVETYDFHLIVRKEMDQVDKKKKKTKIDRIETRSELDTVKYKNMFRVVK